MAANQQATGTRFAGDAMYIGENRQRGAMITYSVYREKKAKVKEEPAASKSKKKKNHAYALKAFTRKKDLGRDRQVSP